MTFHSQAGQDAWVIDQLGDHQGFFVDVGAYDGIEHSNTYALEQRGWTGVCVEPNPVAFEQLRANRSCLLSGWVMSDHNDRIAFDGVQVGNGPEIECRTLTTLLATIGAPDVIDYLSIDTEGHELPVLAGMDFDRWQVRLITIEHNSYLHGPAHKLAIYAALSTLGFRRVVEDVVAPGYGVFEDWYQRAA